jgi:hypothetical protein
MGLHNYAGADKVPNGFVDLFSYRPTNYGVIEGFYSTEGNGPQWGEDVHLNMVIASGDPVAADAVGATIMGYNPDDLGFLHMSAAKGFGTLDLKRVTIVGDPIEAVTRPFKKPGNGLLYGKGNRDWLVNGPYPGDIEADAIPGAASLIPVEGDMANGKVWEKLSGDGRYVDFGKYAGTNMVTYAFSIVLSEKEQQGLLLVGADDGAQIWLNGKETLKQAKLPTKKLDKATDGVKVPITLQQGANPLMVKLVNTYGSAGLSLIAGNGTGDTLPGVSYSLALPAVITAVEGDAGRQTPTARPEKFALRQNIPNPFNPETMIPYSLPQTEVRLEVYSLSGQNVRTLVNGIIPAGDHLVRWDGKDNTGRNVASGTYLARLLAGGGVKTVKMLLVR